MTDMVASCDGQALDDWFPDFIGRGATVELQEHVQYLRQICGPCPMRTQCRLLALRAEGTLAPRSRFGIFGGLTPKQRARIAELSGLLVERDPDVQGDLFDLEAS